MTQLNRSLPVPGRLIRDNGYSGRKLRQIGNFPAIESTIYFNTIQIISIHHQVKTPVRECLMISVLFIDDNTDFLAQFRPVLEKNRRGAPGVGGLHQAGDQKLESGPMTLSSVTEDVSPVNGIEFVSDMDGIGFLRYLRSMGNPAVIIFHRKAEPGGIRGGQQWHGDYPPPHRGPAFTGGRSRHAHQAGSTAQKIGARC